MLLVSQFRLVNYDHNSKMCKIFKPLSELLELVKPHSKSFRINEFYVDKLPLRSLSQPLLGPLDNLAKFQF